MTIGEVGEKYGITTDTLRYYEKVGVIPPVHRNASGIRDYTKDDEAWVELAVCMRSAGLQVDFLAEYVRLTCEGDETIPARLKLLNEQRDILLEKQKQIGETLERLNYKISRYDTAANGGQLTWEKDK